nr:hypothetical protein [uncultured Anaeromusa sp.]
MAFKERIEQIYGVKGRTPHEQYYKEYLAAVVFFETAGITK